MRVVMTIIEFAPILGGAQRQLASLAPLLAARGVEAHVITRAVPGVPAHEHVAGAEVHRLAAPGAKATASPIWTGLALARIHALRPDVVHAFSLFSPTTVAVLAERLLGVPSAVKVLRGGEAGDVRRLLRKRFARPRARAIVRSVGRFVAISDEIDGELASMGVPAERTLRIPNGVDPSRFAPVDAAVRSARRERLALGAGPVVLHCGRWVPEKRVDLLLDVWPRVRSRHPDAELVLLGAGPCEAELRAKAGEGVHFIGQVDDVAPYLEAADVFALPSTVEGLSNAMLEAMAAGLAVVATAVGGALDVIEDGRSGRLVRVDDAEGLTRALLEVCEPARGATLGRAARDAVVRHHSLAAVADRLADLYRQLAAERAAEGRIHGLNSSQRRA